MVIALPDRAPLRRQRPHALHGTALAVLLLALAGCGSDDGPRVQRVAYCQPPSPEHTPGAQVQVEFRQGATVVAQGSVPVGGVFDAAAPPGPVEIYADGARMGEAEASVPPDGPYRSPEPGEAGVYLGGEGCPATPTG